MPLEKCEDPVHAALLRLLAEVGGDDRLGGEFRSRDLREDLLVAEDEHAVDEFDEFIDLAREHHDAHAVGAEPLERRVDLALRHDVDAPRGIVQQEHLRIGREPACEDHLLLAATGEARDGIGLGAEPNAERPHELAEAFRHPRRAEQEATTILLQGGDREVLADRHLLEERLAPPLPRQVGHAELRTVVGLDVDTWADHPGDGAGALGQARQSLDECILPMALKAGEADQLAGAKLEVDRRRVRVRVASASARRVTSPRARP